MASRAGRRSALAMAVPAVGVLLTQSRVGSAAPPVPYAVQFQAGAQAEGSFLEKISGATASDNGRHADKGEFWIYGFAAMPGSRCRLVLTLDKAAGEQPPTIAIAGKDNKPIAVTTQREGDADFAAQWIVPANWPPSARIPVVLSAKKAPFTVRSVRFLQVEPDADGDGVPDTVIALLKQGLPAATPVRIVKPPSRPYTTTQTPSAPTPDVDLQTDTVFVYSSDATAIQGWKTRGYTVWTMGGSRDDKSYGDKHPEEVQTAENDKQITIDGVPYLMPTDNRNAMETGNYLKALGNGSVGVCPEEPEYWASAGYESAFKQAWQKAYNSPWQPPASSLDARWKADRLKATLETNHISSILQATAQRYPGARGMVAMHSPINYANWNIVCPHYAISSLPLLQDVIGQVWTGTARFPIRYAGVRSDRAFSLAYLEYSSLYQLLRGTNKRLWFLTDPLEDDPTRTAEDYKSHYEETLIASLLFPDVDAYEVMPWPTRVYGHIPAPYATEIDTVIAALEDMHNQPTHGGNAASPEVGVFVSDSMQWQREAPSRSDFDGVFGLTLPLLQRGVPVQAVSLDRAADPGYLNKFKVLLLSYDFQKPADPRIHAALADWVRRGGSLLFFGGSDAYNAVSNSWWRQAKSETPQADLWKQLGVPTGDAFRTASAPPEEMSRYKEILSGDGAEHNLKNRRLYTLDLTPFLKDTGSVAVRFGDSTPEDGWGAYFVSATLRVGDQAAAAFEAGSDVESRFLSYDNNSQFSGGARYADGHSSWTYQFDNLPRDQKVTLTVDVGNGFRIWAAPAQPLLGHTLLSAANDNAITKAFPRLRIGADYAASLYPSLAVVGGSATAPAVQRSAVRPGSDGPSVLYNLRSGGAAVWMQTVGKGLALNVGVAPGFFSSSELTAQLLRSLVQYAANRVGANYKEAGVLRLQRGKYTIVNTFAEDDTVDGRTIDLLSPTLAVANDRTIPARSHALLYDLGPDNAPPHVGFVSGRVQAVLETAAATGFFVRGPLNTMGAARLHAGAKRLSGARATDRVGRPVSLQVFPEGSTVLLRYPNHPDGVIVHVGWQ